MPIGPVFGEKKGEKRRKMDEKRKKTKQNGGNQKGKVVEGSGKIGVRERSGEKKGKEVREERMDKKREEGERMRNEAKKQ